jgi:hypothetical protein
MTALTVTAAQVAYVSGPITHDQVAGEAFAAGACLYWNASTGKWLKAQCDGTVAEAGADGIGLALATADASGARLSIALPDAIVTLGAGAAPAAGIIYCPGRTAGSLIPSADLASTDKATVAAIGIGTNKVKVARIYDAGAVIT